VNSIQNLGSGRGDERRGKVVVNLSRGNVYSERSYCVGILESKMIQSEILRFCFVFPNGLVEDGRVYCSRTQELPVLLSSV